MARVQQDSSSIPQSMNNAFNGDSVSYRQVFEQLKRVVPHAEVLMITSLPRAGLQIAQPARVPELILKTYAKQFNTEDRLTWQAILTQTTVRGADCWPAGEFEQSAFFRDMLEPLGLKHAVAVPLKEPVFEGYAGALVVFRSSDEPDFTTEELSILTGVAGLMDEWSEKTRATHRATTCRDEHRWSVRPAVRQYVFNNKLDSLLPGFEDGQLDPHMREQLLSHARQRLGQMNGQPFTSDRVLFPDTRGDLMSFRVGVYRDYPALGGGPVLFFCLQPDFCEWSSLRPNDFQADEELSRLIPAMRFMQEQFRRCPRLTEIAKVVHLSPFHFHRRFTELLGITPKHYMLECQIHQTKIDMMGGQKELVDIARTCGFAHQSHFTSRFKQATGLTPTRWRRLTRRANEEATPTQGN